MELLRMDLMMYGRVRRTRLKRNAAGEKIFDKMDKNGKPVFQKEKYWAVSSKENGDQGIFPSVNTIFIRKGKSVSYTEPAQNLYALWEAQADVWKSVSGWDTTNEKLYLDYYFYMPNDNRKRDTHNILKMNIDSMKGIIFEDDDKVLPRIMDYQKCGEDEPHIMIRVWTKAEHDEYMSKLLSAYDKERKQ